MTKQAPKLRHKKAPPAQDRLQAKLARVLGRCAAAARSAGRRLRVSVTSTWPLRRVRVEILCTDAGRRKALSRAIRTGLRQLRHSVPEAPGVSAIVVSEHVAVAGRQLAGGAYVRRGPGGAQKALLRLALVVDGRALSDDEVLAVLAEQWIGLAMEQGASCVLIPSELPPGADPRRLASKDRDTQHAPERTPERDDDDPLASLLRTVSTTQQSRGTGASNLARRAGGLAA